MQDTAKIKTNNLMSIQMLTFWTKNERTKNVIKDIKDNAHLKKDVLSCGKINVNINMTQ